MLAAAGEDVNGSGLDLSASDQLMQPMEDGSRPAGGAVATAGTAATASYGDMTHAELVEVVNRHEAALERAVEESRRMHAQLRAQETQMATRIAEAAAMAAAEKERAAWHLVALEQEQAKVTRLQIQVKDLELQLHSRKQAEEDVTGQVGKDRQAPPPTATDPHPEVNDDVPGWRTLASNLADTIDIARALPPKQGKQGGGGETLLSYASCQFGSEKKLFVDLKQNDRGRFIKLAVAADGSRQHVFLPADSWSHLLQMIQTHS